MRTTIDKAGRVVIPKELREAIGLYAGEVDIVIEGAGLRLEVPATAHLVMKDGRLVIDAPPGTPTLTDEDVRRMRDALRR